MYGVVNTVCLRKMVGCSPPVEPDNQDLWVVPHDAEELANALSFAEAVKQTLHFDCAHVSFFFLGRVAAIVIVVGTH